MILNGSLAIIKEQGLIRNIGNNKPRQAQSSPCSFLNLLNLRI